jgi:hypothetical protein
VGGTVAGCGNGLWRVVVVVVVVVGIEDVVGFVVFVEGLVGLTVFVVVRHSDILIVLGRGGSGLKEERVTKG